MTPNDKGGKKQNGRVVFPECISVHLKDLILWLVWNIEKEAIKDILHLSDITLNGTKQLGQTVKTQISLHKYI